ncbi:MAG: molybdate ABC transporter permease subunit, partial [Acidobacteriota bacterium]|nr:molybdate ABC transporter permease subunit [Acidobacteriota bacterium]
MLAIDASPLLISLATTVCATIATFCLGLLAAWALYDSRSKLRPWIDGVLTLPLVLPPTVVGFLLLLAFGRQSPLGRALAHIGVTIVFSWPATVLAATVIAFPPMYRTALGALEQVNPTLLEAARTLGASEPRIFRRILLPLAAPGILAGTILAFARALGEFGATLMLAGNIPGRTQT